MDLSCCVGRLPCTQPGLFFPLWSCMTCTDRALRHSAWWMDGPMEAPAGDQGYLLPGFPTLKLVDVSLKPSVLLYLRSLLLRQLALHSSLPSGSANLSLPLSSSSLGEANSSPSTALPLWPSHTHSHPCK